MRSNRLIHVVGCHAEGEVGDVVVGGVAPPPGETLWRQSRFIAEDGRLRNFLLNEPRGGVYRHVNLLVPAVDPQAAMGFIVMEPEDTPPMSGSNSMCVATVLLETGILEAVEPVTRLTLEAPAGLVRIEAEVKNGKVERVTTQNVASFASRLDAALEVEGLGTLKVDTAYGGDSFVVVDAPSLGFSIRAEEARDLVETGIRIVDAANEQLGFEHPDNPDWRHISFCQFTMPPEDGADGLLHGLNTVVVKPGKLDRSPCGTGLSARMALMHARGEMKTGDRLVGRSIIGSRFDGAIAAETQVGGRPAIVPTISGRAWITGTHQIMLDPDDPWPDGYKLSDTWPMLSSQS